MNSKSFFYDFGRALYHMDALYGEFAKQSNVAPTILWVVYALNDNKPHTQIEISKDWDLPKTTVNTAIKELQQSGYVELVPIKGKRREMSIVLTESGKEYADQILSDIYKKETKVYKALSSEEREIASTIEKMVRILKEN